MSLSFKLEPWNEIIRIMAARVIRLQSSQGLNYLCMYDAIHVDTTSSLCTMETVIRSFSLQASLTHLSASSLAPQPLKNDNFICGELRSSKIRSSLLTTYDIWLRKKRKCQIVIESVGKGSEAEHRGSAYTIVCEW